MANMSLSESSHFIDLSLKAHYVHDESVLTISCAFSFKGCFLFDVTFSARSGISRSSVFSLQAL